MPTTPITDWGQAIMTSLAAALALFMGAIPKIIGFLVIMLIGWFIAGLLAKAVAAVLRAVRFNELADRAGISGFVHKMGVQTDSSGVLADIVKWFVRIIVLVVAFDELGLPAVSTVLQQFLLWIPNLIVALVVLVIAGLAAKALGDLVRGATSEAGFSNPDMLASIARIAVWAFGIIVAVNQIGVAATLVDTLFMGFVGALALAAGLAFGLGGRDTAGQIVQGWYQRGQQAAPKLQQAASAAGQQAKQQTQQPRQQMGGQQGQPQQRQAATYQQGSGRTTNADDYSTVEPGFRRHYEATYSNLGYDWNQYQPAYRYGYQYRSDQRYSNRSWSEAEPELRREWEQTHPDSPWENFRDAIRQGFESRRI